MKAQAMIFSPIVSITAIGLVMIVSSNFSLFFEFFPIYILTIIFAIIAQGGIEIVLLVLEKWFVITFKVYLNLASFICTMIGIFVFQTNSRMNFYDNLSESFGFFLFFYIYSIGNAFTYNYLYFKRLEKE
jgi:hypothetical protein